MFNSQAYFMNKQYTAYVSMDYNVINSSQYGCNNNTKCDDIGNITKTALMTWTAFEKVELDAAFGNWAPEPFGIGPLP